MEETSPALTLIKFQQTEFLEMYRGGIVMTTLFVATAQKLDRWYIGFLGLL